MGNDGNLKSIYPFFKQNEALGKHFARRSHSNSWSAGFDQSQYSRDAFRVNQDVIKRVEKQFAKKGQIWQHQIGIQSFLCQKSLSTCLKSKSFCKNMSFIINQSQSIQIQATSNQQSR